MAFRPIREEEGRRRLHFEFDPERGIIRHRTRGGPAREFRIEIKESRCGTRVVDIREEKNLESG